MCSGALCRITAISAAEENSADLTRLVSTIEKAASEHPEEPALKISRAPGMLTISLTGGGMLISVVSAAQPGFVQWMKSRGERSVVFKTKNRRGEREIALTGDYDVAKLREVVEITKDM